MSGPISLWVSSSTCSSFSFRASKPDVAASPSRGADERSPEAPATAL
ncbi:MULTISPECIES: hypothetical protein [unclassified Streptomyces]|nr:MULTISPECIES: hypothetical protein [unclassified Streptomyces]MYS22457.1 hypothetical protein [Streptomyces sp. SID4948]